ncbi:ornithine acetyltransferase [Chloroflexus islandicus]|uniref:Arginine biosynthesis bifunctional protein ArgJ n=1 Tax=Chloroflexus islandicus TaxID=1707952 RepID=A0A178MFB0_9CHLR|nr:bifunctional glutamate N-acetyltransferase/amino-acid acetyltransferase ArgJ [Chloroflexus islandicus]OAN46827.1 ornithine acetyltransferase [Chloroflexus islandicus]
MISFLADGHVASPRGWRAAVAACGIKYANRDDLALVVSDYPATAAAVFTTNAVKAAPVLYDMALMAQGGDLRAVVINAGNANACTGVDGDAAAVAMARAVEQALDLPPNSVFVMSTGTIGVPMPVDKITRGIAEAATRLSPDHGLAVARAIMTTDTRPKHCAVTVTLPDGNVITIGGMAKGAGMIHPNMATMLAVVTTDAAVPRDVLDAAMRQVLEVSFNSISIDGDTSTNDTLLVMANGVSGAPPITDLASPAGAAFIAGLTAVCQHLAHAIVRDGEGATRFVTITVRGAVNNAEAKQAAMTIARSPLVKTALFGADPNWGRVLCAIGYSGVTVDPNRVVLHFGGMRVLENGLPLPFDEKAAHKLLDVPDITIDADLGLGDGSATVWTCDFSYDYVRINAEYRT